MLTVQPPSSARAFAPMPSPSDHEAERHRCEVRQLLRRRQQHGSDGPSNGFPKWPSDAARPQPTFSQQTPGSSGKRATVAQLATGDDEPCSPTCPQGDCAGCAFPPARIEA